MKPPHTNSPLALAPPNRAAVPSVAEATGSASAGLRHGDIFAGRYWLNRGLGSGDEGGVWLAEDLSLQRWIAVKLLPEAICGHPAALAELEAATRRSAELRHRHLAQTYDFVRTGALAAFTMEYVDGETLTQLRLEQPGIVFEAKQVGEWMQAICAALEYAHGQGQGGLVHGGLRPDNVMVDAAGRLKLVGFGLAGPIRKWLARLTPAAGDPAAETHVAPADATPADDVRGAVRLLYELLTGAAPSAPAVLEGGENLSLLSPMAARRADRGIRGEPIPEPWERAVADCLGSDPTRRLRSARELAARLCR